MAKYISPDWQNNGPPKLNASNLKALTDTVEAAQALIGSGAPTTSTEGAPGQKYVDTSAEPAETYLCVGVDSGSYLWEKQVGWQEMALKANIDGSYDGMTVGNAEQLVSTNMVSDQAPYLFRSSGGSADIGNREYDEIVGGTLAWNQLVRNGNFLNASYWFKGNNTAEADANISFSTSGGVMTVTHTTANANGFMWGISQTIPNNALEPGHKFYVAYDVKVSDPMRVGALLNTTPVNQKTPPVGEWYKYRNVIDAPASTTGSKNFFCLGIYEISGSPIPAGATREYKNIQVVDLTLMLGSVLADRIYDMERSDAGSGAKWFQSLFRKSYYEYNAGELLSVNAGAHVMVGFNAYDSSSGTAKLLGGNQYQITGTYTGLNYVDINGNSETITPDDAGLFTPMQNGTLTVTGGNSTSTCVHLVWSGYRDDEFEPYTKHEYPLDDTLTLLGIPMMGESGEMYYDGDRYKSSGTVEKRYAIVDMGTLTYSYLSDERSNRFSAVVTGIKKAVGTAPSHIITSRYPNYGYNDVMYGRVDKSIAGNSVYSSIAIVDSTYSDDETYPTTAEKIAALKASLSGVYMVYEMETPTETTADPFQSPQIVDDFGTEEYVDAAYEAGTRDVSIPVGHYTEYPANLRDKLQHMPGLAERDGDYVIRQTEKQLSLIPDTTPAQVQELSQSTDERFSKTNRMTVLEWTGENAYIGTSGATANLDSPVSYDGFRYAVVDCAPGDNFTVNVSGGITPRAWAFVDGSGNVLSRAESSAVTPNYRDFAIKAPAGAAKLVLNDRNTGLDSYSGVYSGAAIETTGLMNPPVANGTYALKVTVSGSTVTYNWVSD